MSSDSGAPKYTCPSSGRAIALHVFFFFFRVVSVAIIGHVFVSFTVHRFSEKDVCVCMSRSYCFYKFDTKRRRHALRAVLCNITATVHLYNILVSNLQNRIRCTIRVVFHVPDAHTT